MTGDCQHEHGHPPMAPSPAPEAPSRMAYPELQALDIFISTEAAKQIKKHLRKLADLTLSRSEKAELDLLLGTLP